MWDSNMDKHFAEIFTPKISARDMLISLLTERAERVEYGRHRMVFICRNVVYKIALEAEWAADNYSEAFMFERYGKCGQFAPCRLISINGVDGILVMRRVTMPKCDEELPEWVLGIDCAQVGYDKKGRLMAFDYAVY